MTTKLEELVVTRERVVGPLPRFIDVPDGKLLQYFQSVLPVDLEQSVTELHQLLEGISTHSYSQLKRHLESDFSYFGEAAAGTKNPGNRPSEAALDARQLSFVAELVTALRTAHYAPLSSSQWEAASSEDFMMTLPVSINWGALDSRLLSSYYADRQAERAALPAEVADRLLVFHRGIETARLEGSYYALKVDLLISFYLLQPLWVALRALARLLGLAKLVEAAPPGMAASTDASSLEEAARLHRSAASPAGGVERPCVVVERRTFARVFPDGRSVLRSFFKKVSLQEATFRDVVVMYRRAVPDKAAAADEMDIIRDTDPAFLRRNIVIKMFRDIPLADLDLVFPDAQIFVPPQVFVNMVVTIVGGLVAMVMALKAADRLSMSSVFSALSLLGARVGQVYSAANAQRAMVGRKMGQVVYDRSLASQEAVLTTLTEDMRSQRTRELFVCYCVLLHSGKALTEGELDHRCERLLARQWGQTLDFTAEDALPTLRKWEMVVPGPGGTCRAEPLKVALEKLDAIWDGLFDYSGQQGMASAALTSMGSTLGALGRRLPGGGKSKKQAPEAPAPPPAAAPAATKAPSAVKAPAGGSLGAAADAGKKGGLGKRLKHIFR